MSSTPHSHPVLWALHARHIRHRRCLQLVRGKGAPAAKSRAFARAWLAARGTAGLAAMLDDQIHLACGDFKPHVGHVRGIEGSKDLRIQVAASHAQAADPAARPKTNLPTPMAGRFTVESGRLGTFSVACSCSRSPYYCVSERPTSIEPSGSPSHTGNCAGVEWTLLLGDSAQ